MARVTQWKHSLDSKAGIRLWANSEAHNKRSIKRSKSNLKQFSRIRHSAETHEILSQVFSRRMFSFPCYRIPQIPFHKWFPPFSSGEVFLLAFIFLSSHQEHRRHSDDRARETSGCLNFKVILSATRSDKSSLRLNGEEL